VRQHQSDMTPGAMKKLRDLSRPKLKLPKPWSHHQMLADLKGKKVIVSANKPSGKGLVGVLRDFDQWSIALELNDGQALVFKHAINLLALYDEKIHGPA
jgi:RNA chaperone Hfq